ncbi:hypothetical protein LMG22037_05334 [Paraburkholderia phenoliruptrix]|uniref:Uncharacterized protein n=1 Tax=Paraburkholderia phenoliruptrix TaxID=252970 RepID=A0A6J5C5T7_9BURK|nr:hypothetical protein [Paraburkholderia phenoliruptrix]CAB3728027.1 hypothetical protein LMG22037_05334 [Paraburkholderia phenoliruptrix]
MTLDNPAGSTWKLFRDRPFPRVQLLGGGNPEERVRALEGVGKCDVLVVPGGLPDVVKAVSALSTLGMPVLYVAGLDECRGRDCSQVVASGKQAASGTAVYILDRDTVVLDGVRYLGCTFWSSPESAGLSARDWTHDVDLVLSEVDTAAWLSDAMNAEQASAIAFAHQWESVTGGSKASADSARRAFALIENRRAIAWLANELRQRFEGPTVVVTHFAPELRSPNAAAGGAVQSSVRALLRQYPGAVDHWLHGQTDTTTDVAIEGTRVFGGFADEDAALEVGERLDKALSEAAMGKDRRRRVQSERKPILSPVINLEDGLRAPLSSQAATIVEAMRQVHKNVDAIVPHTMTRSSTLRMCVRRTIHDEMQLFTRAVSAAAELERQIYQPADHLQSLLLTTRIDYAVPPGYPAKDSRDSGFDYYELLNRMETHIDSVRGIAGEAARTLSQWAKRAAAILRELEARGIEARAVAPPVHAIRMTKVCEYLDIHVRCQEVEVEQLRKHLREMFKRDEEWPFITRLTRVGEFPQGGPRLLDLSTLLDALDYADRLAVTS